MATENIQDERLLTSNEVISKLSEYNSSEFYIDTVGKTRSKNLETMKYYDIKEEEIVDYIKSLENRDYIGYKETKDYYDCKYLYEFKVKLALNDPTGREDIVKIYIKIGFKRDNTLVYIVSFHENE